MRTKYFLNLAISLLAITLGKTALADCSGETAKQATLSHLAWHATQFDYNMSDVKLLTVSATPDEASSWDSSVVFTFNASKGDNSELITMLGYDFLDKECTSVQLVVAAAESDDVRTKSASVRK